MFHVPVLFNACGSLSLPASFVLLFANVFYGQRPIHYLQAALLFLLINAVHCLAFPSLHGLVFVFFLPCSESWHNLCWHFSAIDRLISSAFLLP